MGIRESRMSAEAIIALFASKREAPRIALLFPFSPSDRG
jgi:hypothetical protein